MADVIDFPGGPKIPPNGDVWDQRTRAFDVEYALAVLKKQLPPEALRNVTRLELEAIARSVLLAVDTARHERRFDPNFDKHKADGVEGAIERLLAGPSQSAEPSLSDPEGTT